MMKKIYCNLPDLNSNEVYICHIGDGEYEFNVFGAVYNNMMKMIRAIAEKNKCNTNDLRVFRYSKDSQELFLEIFIPFIERKPLKSTVACITIEKLNPDKYPNDY